MIKLVKPLLLIVGLLTIQKVNAQVNTLNEIKISNKSNLAFEEAIVEIPWGLIVQKWPKIDTSNFKVIAVNQKKELPFQLEHRGEKQIKKLLVRVSIPANSNLLISLQKGKAEKINYLTYARYVPERKDDFAWENDRGAFRMYGKALEDTKENAYGLDVWTKSTDRLVLNERYKNGTYHTDHGDGLDYYHVGFSLGAGNIVPFVNDTLWYSKNYRRFEILDNGPLRSTFRLYYDEWSVAGKPVKVIKTISLDAGSQLNRMEISYDFNGDNLPVAVGIIKRPEPGTILLDEKKAIMGYWEPQHGNDGIIGVGSVIPASVQVMKVDKQQLLSIGKASANQPYIYYTGAAWNKAGKITTSNDWFQYLQDFATKLEHPLEISSVALTKNTQKLK
ncbi:DUF4861 family protein [Solitalea lacus]|uniref:DUF4861 family protein n=1 Tax=Solitalea lacus TaxID=2911172 RepID=UPI001EDB510B|nr:DUF4861 family protein [Solitalea lacus]UKJ07448.1 DUF4861 domain-containing protein [Solitalea lacus]